MGVLVIIIFKKVEQWTKVVFQMSMFFCLLRSNSVRLSISKISFIPFLQPLIPAKQLGLIIRITEYVANTLRQSTYRDYVLCEVCI